MPISIHFQYADGRRETRLTDTGQSLMRAATAADVDGIVAMCGGCLSCATCHVIVAPEWLALLPPAASDEQSMLEMTASERQAGSRLACQIALEPGLDGLVVTVPEAQ
ncbi:MAG: 2Fe-2S iron-sulfur cluster-binding protein [Rubrivivax sp.]|nr:2Fe-2S iron-sulfur cluster-binding protein [Rubrivivax sp.]